ncbi:opsin 8, group member c [Paramisgurnus dabryanus]|uniref:opsin 8, group member c n=1 Tax=Paramisgurnus dabryanus TaxID=90735 RepID=UPI003CCF1669
MFTNTTRQEGVNGRYNSDIFTSKLTPSADIAVGFAIMLIVIVSVLGNGVVLVISYRRRKKIRGSELLCVNLAAVDFLCCICLYPLSIISSFNHAWLGRHVSCVYYGLGCFIFGLCGMFTIAGISLIRYIKACYAVWIEASSIRLVCVATWLTAAVWSSFPLFGWGEYVPEPYGISCTVAWRRYHTSKTDAAYVICTFVCFVLIPVLLIVTSQCRILLKVFHFSRALSIRGIQNNLRQTEKHLSVMFVCISMGFVIAWAPYTVVSFLFIFYKDARYMAPEGFVFPALFAKSSHIYNPFIYFYFNKTFRQELRSLLFAVWPRLARKRIGVVNPIQIQVQEQTVASNQLQDKSDQRPGLNRHVVCWVSKIQVTPINDEQRADRQFLSTS